MAVKRVLRAGGASVPPEAFVAVLLDVIRAADVGPNPVWRGEDVCDWLERIGCSEGELGGPLWADELAQLREGE